MNLSPSATQLLRILVDEIGTDRFDPDKPDTFMGYGEALERMDLPDTAPRGRTDGETLQENGMQNLAVSLFRHPAKPPAITALLVSKHRTGSRPPNLPGGGFFRACKRADEDWSWWLDEARKAINFDWSQYLPPLAKAEPKSGWDSLTRSLVEKAGYSNGWENVLSSSSDEVVMTSARHDAEARVRPSLTTVGVFEVSFPKGPAADEIGISFPDTEKSSGMFVVEGLGPLGSLLRRAAELAMSLPNHAADLFAEEVSKIEANPPSTTETVRLAKQRIGQALFRQALMDYWGGACAVTGLDVPELLRASHAKPWAKCDTDHERLDVFNGFLLAPHLDALFDQGLVTFSDSGEAIVSPRLTSAQRALLGLEVESTFTLRWISPLHRPYLKWHRSQMFHA
jgi:hypothetical protein